jgi:hypothetical protein
MSTRDKPACQGVRTFLRAHKLNLGALTGQDSRALSAIVHCLELYSASDETGRTGALSALRALLPAMQEHTQPLAREAIAYVLDWGDIPRLWPLIKPEGA